MVGLPKLRSGTSVQIILNNWRKGVTWGAFWWGEDLCLVVLWFVWSSRELKVDLKLNHFLLNSCLKRKELHLLAHAIFEMVLPSDLTTFHYHPLQSPHLSSFFRTPQPHRPSQPPPWRLSEPPYPRGTGWWALRRRGTSIPQPQPLFPEYGGRWCCLGGKRRSRWLSFHGFCWGRCMVPGRSSFLVVEGLLGGGLTILACRGCDIAPRR